MSDKPADIPEDAWQSALACLSGAIEREPEGIRISKTLLIGTVEATARAIMAATERAALVAQGWKPPRQDITEPTKLYRPFEVADAIAAAIRQGAQPSNAIPHNGEIA